MQAHAFHGGLCLPGHKQAAATPIRPGPQPQRLWVPLCQHAGPPGEPCVQVGEQVAVGQPLSVARDPRALPVHAPVSARVAAIAMRPSVLEPTQTSLHIELVAEGALPPWRLPRLDPEQATPEQLLQRLAEAGIAGLGGGGFPTHAKLASPRPLLILNGAECEPHIACDDRLLRERSAQVRAGGRLLGRMLGAQRIVCAIEDSMPDAAAALRATAAADDGIEVVELPARYPQGGERQLIEAVSGQQVPAGGLPGDIGIAVVNVGTAAAAWAAVVEGRPLTHRLVSVGGRGVRTPGVFEVAFGTSVGELVAAAGGYTEAAARLLLGGSLMGIALPHDDFALGKTCNSVLVLAADELPAPTPAMPCIRCGDCAGVCPSRLLPQQLFAMVQSEHWPRLREHGIAACIECGSCDLVCPSRLPLTESFRHARRLLQAQDEAAARAAGARQRYEAREQRQREAAIAREQKLQQRAGGAQSDAVRLALQRARDKALRRSGQDGP